MGSLEQLPATNIHLLAGASNTSQHWRPGSALPRPKNLTKPQIHIITENIHLLAVASNTSQDWPGSAHQKIL